MATDAPLVLVRVLGGIQLEVAGRPLALSPQQRQLVAAIAAGPRHGTSTDELIDRLWGDRPPARARKLLQGLVLRVRRTVSSAEPRAEVFRTTERGYALSGAAVDVDLFSSLTIAARTIDDDHEGRASRLGEALELWRGRPYGEFGDETWAIVERARLEAVHAEAQVAYLESILEAGRQLEALPMLEALTRSEPLHEPYWALLMHTLTRLGREAEALNAYERARGHLLAEIGTEPGSRLRQLEATLREDLSPARSQAVA